MSNITLEFAPEIEEALSKTEGYKRAEDSHSHKMDFDSQGSIRLIDYNEDGKRVKDYVLNESLHKSKVVEVPDGRNQELVDLYKQMHKDNKRKSYLFLAGMTLLFLLVVACFWVIYQLKGGI